MYRIKVTGYVQYHEGDDPDTSLQNRAYGTNFENFKYLNFFRHVSVLERNFQTEEEARLAMAKSYRGVDDYGLGLTWTVIRRGAIVVTGAEAIAYAEKKGEALYVSGDLGESDWQVDFGRALEICQHSPSRLYTTADPLYIINGSTELTAVNPAKAQVVAQKRGEESVALYSAPGVGQESGDFWYYLETDGKGEVVDPENPDPKAAAALEMSEEELRQILDWHLRENTEDQGRTEGLGI
jgi:hypothetical protein